MNKILLTAMPLAVAAMFAFIPVTEPLPLGSSIPKSDVKMKNTDGKEVSFNDAKRKNGLMVMFSCNTCPWVIKNQSRTSEVCKYASDREIGVIILNSNEANRDGADSYEEMQGYAKEQKYAWNYAVDKNSVMADAFGANRTPECYLFNSDMKLVYHGAIDDNPGDAGNVNRKHLTIAMDEMTAGKEISQKESRSLGCNIKRLSD